MINHIIVESSDQTKPFFVHHFELNGVKKLRTPNSYGKYFDNVREVIDVYVDARRNPYYIWTEYGNGKKKLEELKRKFEGKWIVADILFRGNMKDRIRGVGIKVIDEPKYEPLQWSVKKEPEKSNGPEQLELDLFEGTDMKNENRKVTLTISQIKKLVKEASEDFELMIDNSEDQEQTLKDLGEAVGFALSNLQEMRARRYRDQDTERWESDYKDELAKILALADEIRKFDALQ